MAQGRGALVDKVRVGMGGGRDAIVERIALARNGLRAVARDVGDEARLAEGRLGVILGRARAGAFVRGLPVLVAAAAAIDAEESLDLLRDLAVAAVDLLVGGELQAGKGPLLRHGGVGVGGRVKEMGHGHGWAQGGCQRLALAVETERERRSSGWGCVVQCGSSGPCLSSDVDAVQGPGHGAAVAGAVPAHEKEWRVMAHKAAGAADAGSSWCECKAGPVHPARRRAEGSRAEGRGTNGDGWPGRCLGGQRKRRPDARTMGKPKWGRSRRGEARLYLHSI